MIELPALYKHQEDIRDRTRAAIKQHGRVILTAPPGCHAKGQGVMLYDGRIRSVEDIAVDDLLMGPDSLPRRVLSLNRGQGEMYRITPTKGAPMVVNLDHVLTLVRSADHSTAGGEVVDVSLREWFTWNSTMRHHFKLFRAAVDFAKTQQRPELEPYLLGVVLGDGSLHNGSVCVTTDDPEIVRYLKTVAERYGLRFRSQRAGGSSQTHYLSQVRRKVRNENPARVGYRVDVKPGDQYGMLSVVAEQEREITPGMSFRRFACRCQCGTHVSVRLSNLRSGNTYSCGCLRANPVSVLFRQHGLGECNSESKFVPHVFKTASRYDRLEVLAGLLDTDGHLLKKTSSGYDYISKSRQLSEDVAFLARSVGLAAYVHQCEKRDQHGNGGTYWRVGISGDCSIIPCRLPWKMASPRRQKKDVLRTGFTVSKVGDGDYFGFTLDGDGRYLLDDFTVTHNCGKTRMAKWILGASANRDKPENASGRSLFAVQRRGLVQNATDSFCEEPELPHGVIMSGVETSYGSKIQVASIDTLLSWFVDTDSYKTDITFDLVVIDEAHSHHNKFARFLKYHDQKREEMGLHKAYVIGLTATPQAKGLADVYKEIVLGPSTDWLIENRFLSPFRYFRATQGKLGLLVKRGNEFTKESECAAMDGLAGDLVRDWKKYADGRPTVGFFPRRSHAKDATAMLEAEGLRVAYVDGETPDEERRSIFRQLNYHQIDYLCNVQVVERGTDIPRVGCIQLCVAIGSLVRYRQMVGRGSRVHPDKTDCYVLDHAENVRRHGFFEDDPQWSLDVTTKDPGEVGTRPTIECPRCCLARGTMILTDRGEVPIQDVLLTDRVWDGVEWCSHGGTSCNGTREVIDWGGLKLTPDHKVLTNGGWKEAEAAKVGSWRPVAGGIGRTPIWTVDHSNPYYPVQVRSARSGGGLRTLRKAWMEILPQNVSSPTAWMRTLHGQIRARISSLACAESKSAETALPVPAAPRIQDLWWTRDRISVFIGDRRSAVDCGEIGIASEQIVDNRQDRQQRPLRAWKLAMGDDENAGCEPGFGLGKAILSGVPICLVLIQQPNTTSKERLEPKANCVSMDFKVRGISNGNSRNFMDVEVSRGIPVRDVLQHSTQTTQATRLDATRDRRSLVAEVWDIVNVGPRNRYTANGVIVANCAIYRGGKCKNCGYEPTPKERRSQGLDFDGRELKEVKREEKKANVKTAEELMVSALYSAGRSGRIWRQAVGIFKRACEKQGSNYRVPSAVTIAGHRYRMLRFGEENGSRRVAMLYPVVVGGGHGGEYLIQERETATATF